MKLIAALLISLLSAATSAQTFEKNGRPCVSEICVGDGLQELKGIQWSPLAFKEAKVSKFESDAIGSRFRGDLPAELKVFLVNRKFDGKALALLPAIKIRCSKDETSLQGEYTTKTGNRTEVIIELLQEGPAAEQKWTVVNIRRFVQGQLSSSDMAAAKQQLVDRYRKFNVEDEKGYRKTKLIENGTFTFNGFTTWFSFDLDYSSPDYNSSTRNFRLPAQCARTINVD